MLNQVKSTYSVPSPRSEAKALVEAFAHQDQQKLYPFQLQNFKLGVRFQSADPQTQRVIVMAVLSWLDQHSLRSYGREDQNAWQMGWKMREAFLHMLQSTIAFQEQDVIAMLNWSASQSSTSAYVYFSGVPQIIKVVGAYLKSNPMTDRLHEAIQLLTETLEMESQSVEVRRWILRLKKLTGETQVGLPLASGDPWADAALKELYRLDERSKKAWSELLAHCLQAKGTAPAQKWLSEADQYIKTIGSLNFYIKLLHWFPLAEKSFSPNRQSSSPSNVDILRGLVWLCSRSDDTEIAHALADLALASFRKSPGPRSGAAKVGNACLWSLANMPGKDGIRLLTLLREKITANNIQKRIDSALEMAYAIG